MRPGVGGQAGGGTVGGVTGPGGFSPQGGFSDWVQNYQFFDDLSRLVGKHTLKFGFEFLRNHTDLVNGNGNGSVGFFNLVGFLQNEPVTVRMPTIPPWTAGNTKHYNRNSVFGGYVQDDWKMRSNLTVNVGLRYEMSTIPFEKNGKFILLPTLWADPGNCVETITGLPIGCSGAPEYRSSLQTQHSRISSPESVSHGIRLTPERPRYAAGSVCLMFCPCRSCLGSMPCKPLRPEPSLT